MHAIFEYGAAVPAPTANCDPDRALIVTRQLLAFPRWYYLTAFVLLPVVFVILPDKNLQDVAQLERLAPRIERAQALAPEARDRHQPHGGPARRARGAGRFSAGIAPDGGDRTSHSAQ